MKYKAEDIRRWDISTYVEGKWIPARPLPYGGLCGLKQRIKYALLVLVGKYDALDWGDQ